MRKNLQLQLPTAAAVMSAASAPAERRVPTLRQRLGRAAPVAATAALLLAACGGPGDDLGREPSAVTLNPDKTATIHVHGWNLPGATKTGNVGDDRGGGSTVDGIRRFSTMPAGTTSPTAPNQIVATEYYGATFPSYYTAADQAEVTAQKGIPRYALIVAKYARQVLDRSGAEGINLTCHSMGCEISRYLIENDVGHLVSAGKIRRWVSFAGVVNGATLADIDGGMQLDKIAKLLGLDLVDVAHMNRSWVQQYVAAYDHRRVEGNNPLWSNLLVHHILSTDPRIDTALGIPLMDVFGYSKVANDGIVLDDEMYLHSQTDAAKWVTPSGALLPVSQSHHLANHFNITDHVGAQAIAAAALTGKRRARVTLTSLTLYKDHETGLLDKAPAEVVVESQVRYPYVKAIEPSDPLLDEVTTARRNAPLYRVSKGETQTPNYVVFDGPVFDAQTSVALSVKLSETDFYPAAGLNENALAANAPLGELNQEVPLTSGDYTVTTADVKFTVHVAVETLY
jgi:hypothetical protein